MTDISSVMMPAAHGATASLYVGALHIESNRAMLGIEECQAVVVIDLVGMHWANKKFGWAGVDKRIRAAHRSSDVVFRLGGDEYAVFTASMADAAVMAERVCQAYSQEGLKARYAIVAITDGWQKAIEDGLKEIDSLKAHEKKGFVAFLHRIPLAVHYLITGEVR